MKKAQGLTMNVVIIAALALLVLIILSVFMASKFQFFGATVKDCDTNRGVCKATCDSDEAKLYQTNCPEGEICCIPTS